MDTKQKKQQLEQEFQKNQQMLAQLAERQAQIRGQWQLLDEMEKEPKEETKVEDNKK
jgi:hypothetical protein